MKCTECGAGCVKIDVDSTATTKSYQCPSCCNTFEVSVKQGAKRHRWSNGDTCVGCGLHREGAGAGPYGSMRYYRDGERFYDYLPGPCVATGAAS